MVPLAWAADRMETGHHSKQRGSNSLKTTKPCGLWLFATVINTLPAISQAMSNDLPNTIEAPRHTVVYSLYQLFTLSGNHKCYFVVDGKYKRKWNPSNMWVCGTDES